MFLNKTRMGWYSYITNETRNESVEGGKYGYTDIKEIIREKNWSFTDLMIEKGNEGFATKYYINGYTINNDYDYVFGYCIVNIETGKAEISTESLKALDQYLQIMREEIIKATKSRTDDEIYNDKILNYLNSTTDEELINGSKSIAV